MDYARHILERLLTSYENSSLFRGGNTRNRSISMRFTPKEIPDYFIDTSARHKEEINAAAEQLSRQGIISIKWVKFEEGNLIERVILNPDRLEEAYRLAGKPSRTRQEGELKRLLQKTASQAKSPWLKEFCSVMEKRLEYHESLHPYLALEEIDASRFLLHVLLALEEVEGEVPRRVFSLQALGDSKSFARLENRALKVMRDFSGRELPENDKEAWAELGLVENPQHIYVSGRLTLQLGNDTLPVASFYPDLGLPAAILAQAQVVSLESEYIITIENLTSFYQFVRAYPEQKYLAIYLGGYHNTLRRQFILKLKDYLEENSLSIPFCHWGDIDYGGFAIFHHLKTRCAIELKPVGMDIETLKNHRRHAANFTAAYGQRLERLLRQENYAIFHPVIQYMLENRLRLEQEAIDPRSLSLPEVIRRASQEQNP